ncbi:MAG TPA: porin family protein, partial [Cyclobacteriaceae bacterium]|nr:porin family protein [Cyclobacteriaceae bacterium]
NPEFIANPSRDPIDVYYLSRKFTATPIFTPHFRIGLSTSLPRTIYNLNTSSAPGQYSDKNTFKVGYQLGGGFDWNLDERWSLCIGFGYARKVIKSTLNDGNQGWTGTFTEKQDWFDIPLYLKYGVDSGRLRPFAYAGIAANLLIGSKLSPVGDDYYNQPGPTTRQVSQAPDQSIGSMRNFFNRSLVFGGGAKYKVGKNFFYVDVRYMAGLSNLARNSGFNPLLPKFEYQSNFFRLDNLSISFGYVKPLYNPRKKGRVVAGLLEKLGLKKSGK